MATAAAHIWQETSDPMTPMCAACEVREGDPRADEPCAEPRAVWTPKLGTRFLTHGPGAKFTPDGTGGGTLEWVEVVNKRGFRPKIVTRRIVKKALAAQPT